GRDVMGGLELTGSVRIETTGGVTSGDKGLVGSYARWGSVWVGGVLGCIMEEWAKGRIPSHGALDLGFKVLWSKNEGTDKVLEGTAQEYESTAGANLSTAEVYESTAPIIIQDIGEVFTIAYQHMTPIDDYKKGKEDSD
ncbi:hypothetical protein Tco_0957008, partial [Tanacetum coccineum]